LYSSRGLAANESPEKQGRNTAQIKKRAIIPVTKKTLPFRIAFRS
jgi:hypothetical protein